MSKFRFGTRIEWFVGRLLGGRPKIVVEKTGDMTWLSDGKRRIAIVREAEAWFYKRGIDARLRRLMHRYSLGELVPIHPGDVVVNCGANVGEVAMALAERGCRVLAVEPDPQALRCLRANVGSMPSVEIAPVGLWNEDKELTFYLAANSSDTSAINTEGTPAVITAWRLDSLAAARGLDRIKLFVGDAEGGEPEVMEGAAETLGRTEFVSFDCGRERRGETTSARCASILTGLGFKILDVDIHHRLVARRA
jgi:FkbM family methyltransferase